MRKLIWTVFGLLLISFTSAQEISYAPPARTLWSVNAGAMLTVSTSDLEVKPFLEATYSSEIASSGINVDAGAMLEFYLSDYKYGIGQNAVGGNASAYLGLGLFPNTSPAPARQVSNEGNTFDIRTFSGSGASVSSWQVGYGVSQWFGGFPGVDTWTLTSRAGVIYLGHSGSDTVRWRLIYGNDNLPLGDFRDSNESAFGSFEIGGGVGGSLEIGFRNVTDQVLYGAKEEVDAQFRLPNRVSSGYRLVREPYTDEARGLGTSLTVGPGVKNHIVFIGMRMGAMRFRLGVDGKLAYDLTQGLMHQAFGFHGLPHKESTGTFFEFGLDLRPFFDYGLSFTGEHHPPVEHHRPVQVENGSP